MPEQRPHPLPPPTSPTTNKGGGSQERSSARSTYRAQLLKICALSGLIWGGIYLTDRPDSAVSTVSQRAQGWPPVGQWRSISFTRVGWPTAHLSQTSSGWRARLSSAAERSGHATGHATDHATEHTERPLDPLLAERINALKDLVTLEEREIDSEDARRALGLTEVALTATLTWSDIERDAKRDVDVAERATKKLRQSSLQSRRFRIGAEHLRHSTWVAPVNAQGQLIGGALRVSGRLRRVFDHEPQRWADRRVSRIEPAEVSELSCVRGPRRPEASPSQGAPAHQPLTALRRAWTLSRAESSWRVKRKGLSPLLDQSATDTLSYTLSSLRFDRFLSRDALPREWRPTHTYSWRSAEGVTAWLSVGRAKIGPARQISLIGVSDLGVGVIPQHLGSLLSPQLTSLLKRAPLPAPSETLTRVSYLPPPAPLAPQSASTGGLTPSRAWSVEKRATGWWLTDPEEAPLSPDATQRLISALTRDSAAASFARAGLKSGDGLNDAQAMGAELRLTVVDEGVCASINAQPPCQLTLTQRGRERISAVMSWRRVEDGVSLSLSQAHHSALTRLPKL